MVRYWWNLSTFKQKIIIACCWIFILAFSSISYGIFFTRVDANPTHMIIFIVSNWLMSYAALPYIITNYVWHGDTHVIRRTDESYNRLSAIKTQTLSSIKCEIDELIESIETDFWVKYTVDDFNCFENVGGDDAVFNDLIDSSLLEKMLAYEQYMQNSQLFSRVDEEDYEDILRILVGEIASYFGYIPIPMGRMYLDILDFDDGTHDWLIYAIKEYL